MPNPTALSLLQTGYRLMKGEQINNIINRVNGIIAGALTGSWAGTFNGILGGTTPAAATVTDFTQNGNMVRTAQTLAAAGASQGDAGLVTKSVVIVTVTASTQGIKLPAAAAGQRVEVFGATGVGVIVYPSTDDLIAGNATNAGITLAAGKSSIFQAVDGQVWRVLTGA